MSTSFITESFGKFIGEQTFQGGFNAILLLGEKGAVRGPIMKACAISIGNILNGGAKIAGGLVYAATGRDPSNAPEVISEGISYISNHAWIDLKNWWSGEECAEPKTEPQLKESWRKQLQTGLHKSAEGVVMLVKGIFACLIAAVAYDITVRALGPAPKRFYDTVLYLSPFEIKNGGSYILPWNDIANYASR